jgi:hypothetical protein
VEFSLLARHKANLFRDVDFEQLRPKPSFDLHRQNTSVFRGEDYKGWF